MERVLTRMRLTNKAALTLMGLLILGHFLPEVPLSATLAVNLSLLVPLGIVLYLITTTSSKEARRALLTSVLVALLLWITDKALPIEPGRSVLDVDPLYLGGVFAAFIAYLLGRSRRSAFIGAFLGILLVDLVATLELSFLRVHQITVLGGSGIFDASILGGILAVILAEGFGELRERLGPKKEKGDTHE